MSAEIQEYEVDAISQEAEVEVVLGSIAISSDELVLLRPGVAIEISMDESLPVAVRVGGRTIGRATLAVSDNQLMLTVFEMLE